MEDTFIWKLVNCALRVQLRFLNNAALLPD